MPRYFFDVRLGSSLSRDTEGIECESLAGVRREAIRILSDIAVCKTASYNFQEVRMLLVRNELDIIMCSAKLVYSCIEQNNFIMIDEIHSMKIISPEDIASP